MPGVNNDQGFFKFKCNFFLPIICVGRTGQQWHTSLPLHPHARRCCTWPIHLSIWILNPIGMWDVYGWKTINNCFQEGWELNDAPSVETGAHFSVLYLTFHSLPAFSFVQWFPACDISPPPPSQISLDLCSAAFSYYSTLVFARYHFLCTPMKSHIFPSGSHSLSLTFLLLCQWMNERISKRWREM